MEKVIEANKMRSYQCKSMSSFEDSFDDDNTSAVWQEEAKAIIEGTTLRSLFFNGSWVYILVDHYSRFMSLSGIQVKRKVMQGGEVSYEPADEHPLNVFLSKPNDYTRWQSFIYSLAVDYLLMGNVIIFKNKKGQLYRIPSESVQIIFNEKTGLPLFYQATTTLADHGIEQVRFSVAEILHIKRPNPQTLFWGLSPFVPGRKSVLFDRYSKDYTIKFYNRGAAPDAVLETADDLSKVQQEQLLRTFELKYTGRGNQRRTILLPAGVKFNPITVDMVSQRFLELVESNREEIINLTHTPKHALGLQETGSLGSEEHKMALQYYYMTTLLPDLEMFASELGAFLLPNDLEHELWLNTEQVEHLFENTVRKADLATKLLPIATVNEIRQRVLDWEPMEGGDVLASALAPKQTPSSFMLALPNAQQEKSETKACSVDTPARYRGIDFTPPPEVSAQALRGLTLREELKRGATLTAAKRAHQLVNREVISCDVARRMFRFFSRNDSKKDAQLPNGEPANSMLAWLMWGGDAGKAWAEKLWEQMEAADDAHGTRFDKTSFIAEHEDDPGLFMRFDTNFKNMAILESKFKAKIDAQRKALDDVQEKKIESYRKDVQALLLDMLKLSMPIIEKTIKSHNSYAQKATEADYRRLERDLLRAYRNLGKQAREDHMTAHSEAVELGYDSQLDLVFNEPAHEAIAALRARDAKGRNEMLAERGLDSFAWMSQTTSNQIVGLVRKGLENNQTIAQIAKTIRDSYPQVAMSRSETIARTETLTAFSIGQQASMENTKEVLPEARKVWISAQDERVRGNPSGLYPDARDNHWELSGEIRKLDEDFSNGLALPRDTRGEPHQVINCRCSLATLMPEDIEEFAEEIAN